MKNHKYESFDGHLKGRNNSWIYMLCTQIPFIHGLGAPTFTYGAKILEGDLKNSHWKVFKKA